MSSNGKTHDVRLSFRSPKDNFDKLVTIAKSRGWINQRGKPNLSKVINHLIESFDASKDSRKVKGSRGKR